MTPEPLKPRRLKFVPVKTPQCDVAIPRPDRDSYSKYMLSRHPKKDHGRCIRDSTYRIGGLCYCTTHAGQKALELWLDGKIGDLSVTPICEET